MAQILIGTQKVAFSHELFSPDTLGHLSLFPKELVIEIFKRLDNESLASAAVLNWTCKEVVERNTEWGERKRFFRILPSLFNHVYEHDRLYFDGFWVDTEVKGHILDLYPNKEVHVRNIRIRDVLMLTFSIGSFLDSSSRSLTFFYKDNGDEDYPRYQRQEEHHYQLHENKLQKITLSNPPQIVKELDLSTQTKSAEIGGFSGNRLLVWLNPFDLNDQNKNFCTLQEINKETFQIEKSHHFYPSPETPLFSHVTHIYLDEKFCIVIGNQSCVIKMGKSTLRVKQKLLAPLLKMKIDQVSIQNKPEGQMKVILKGVKGYQDICMHDTTDPFNPL